MRTCNPFVRLTTALCLLCLFTVGALKAQDQELPLGSPLPDAGVTLTAPGGDAVALGDVMGSEGTVFIFWSNQCPWVDRAEDRLKDLAKQHSASGFAFVAVNANNAEAFPQEGAEESQRRARALGSSFTYLMDEGGALAKALGASRTPHVFVFDSDRTLVYVGTIDDSPGDPRNVTKTYLADALQALSEGGEIAVPKTKAFGCTIKLP